MNYQNKRKSGNKRWNQEEIKELSKESSVKITDADIDTLKRELQEIINKKCTRREVGAAIRGSKYV